MPNEPPICPPNLPASLAWSPNAKNLVAAWGGWQPKLHVFDLQARALAGDIWRFRECAEATGLVGGWKIFCGGIGWQEGVAARVGSGGRRGQPLRAAPAGELGVPGCIERQTYEAEFGDDGAFSGYGSTAFSPDGELLASVVQIQGEWADDSILIADVPGLHEQTAAQAQGHITSLSWTPDGQGIVYCAAGQAYRLALTRGNPSPCRPRRKFAHAIRICRVCLCFSSWLKNSAKGQLFLVDLNRMSVV